MTTMKRSLAQLTREIAALGACLGLLLGPSATSTLAQGLPLIRDTEIENLLKDYARPIFKVAGLSAQNITMRIIRHDSFNAFVADGHNVFMNTGALQLAKTPNELIGVIAHETGHITGGHLAALRARIARDQTKALLVGVLGIGAMIVGATSKTDSGREVGGLGQGVMFGGNEVITRGILSERRSQEAAADQAGLNFLSATKQSGMGMQITFERFAQQEYISEKQMDPFVRSHPVATTRIAQLRDKVAKSPYVNQKDDPALQLRHDLMRAKIAGFLERPQAVANSYPASDRGLPARYARAIAANCSGKCDTAIAQVDGLIAEQPQNPFFHELKGDLLYAAGKAREAIPHMRKARQLFSGNAPMMDVNLAQALIATQEAGPLDEAINLLRKATIIDDDNSQAFQLLANAYYKKNMAPQATLAAAQGQFSDGNFKQAKIFAKRAQVGLKQGTPEWIKAEDIITFKIPEDG
jgi:predicted Zn-dependent protease